MVQLRLSDIADDAQGVPGPPPPPPDQRDIRIGVGNGICLRLAGHELHLDPKKRSPVGIVTHAHIDHLTRGALMTPQTRDIMAVRLGTSEATVAGYDETVDYAGFPVPVVLRNAGHVLGSAMVEVGDVLYTGDVNPDGGLTCPPAVPRRCRVLITEATYGSGEHRIPPKREVLDDFVSWAGGNLRLRPVVIGGYEFGKAQELVAACNGGNLPVVVTPEIGHLCDVYRRHGVPLKYRVLGTPGAMPEELRAEQHVLVVSKHAVTGGADPLVQRYRNELDAATAVASGWAHTQDLTGRYGLDAQFPVSDHASFDRLLEFITACAPEQVFTVFGSPEELARAVTEHLGIPAQALTRRRGRSPAS